MKTATLLDLKQAIDRAIDMYGEDKPVVFTADYGDRCHTMQALSISGDLEERSIRESGYSSSGYAVNEPDDDRDDSNDETVLVIT